MRIHSFSFLAHATLAAGLTLTSATWSRAQEHGATLLDVAAAKYQAALTPSAHGSEGKLPAGTTQVITGQFGPARQFSFAETKGQQFFTADVRPSTNWDAYEGFSFWVKGDGSRSWGGMQLIDGSDYAMRYGYCFPIEATNWTQVVVRWSDLTPELAAPLVDPQHGYAPSRFRNLWFGKWFYWREWPACTYAIERIVLEKTIPCDSTHATPVAPGMSRFLAKLKSRQPVTIVTMGDSLSDKRHWANRTNLWSEEVAAQLKTTYGSEVTLINPAMGGTTLSQNTLLIPRWARDCPRPDLVTIWFGFNDWDSNVRGPRFKEYLNLAVDRVRRATGGQADILILTTCPAFARWDAMSEMCSAARDVARERQTGLADVACAFQKAGSPEEALKRDFWAWDKTHLGAGGHALAAQTVLAAIAEQANHEQR